MAILNNKTGRRKTLNLSLYASERAANAPHLLVQEGSEKEKKKILSKGYARIRSIRTSDSRRDNGDAEDARSSEEELEKGNQQGCDH